jgi:hypothetical protein
VASFTLWPHFRKERRLSGTVGIGVWVGPRPGLGTIMAKRKNAVVGKWPAGCILVYVDYR